MANAGPHRPKLMTKSKIAFEFSCNRFKGPEVYFWTFTFTRCLAVKEARRLLAKGIKALRQQAGFRGIRAYELHPGGHGLHMHVVTEARYDVREIRHIWTGRATEWEGGRINVKVVPRKGALYLGKYLAKGMRPPCLKGVRMWAGIGGFETDKVADIVCMSRFAIAWRWFNATLEGFRALSYCQKRNFVRLVEHNALLVAIGDGHKQIPLPAF